MSGALGFVELGAIILAWTIVWSFLIKGWTGAHPDSPITQGLAAIFHA